MKHALLRAGGWGFLAAGLVFILGRVDVAPIGPAGTRIGLSRLNGTVAAWLGRSDFWYTVTEALGAAVVLLAIVLALWGLAQAVYRKSLRRADAALLFLGGLYAVTVAVYFFFEKFPVNFRPVLLAGQKFPEPSFPSSHTLLAWVVLGSAGRLARHYLPKNALQRVLRLLCAAGIAGMTLGRLLSGVHWCTDILGGVIFGEALLSLYDAALADRL